uniref:RecA family profile 1 domain-containing protein n=1 Tax=Sinocyclocheilus rhinocerous TaxID=307959 RepID=A0A673MA96_9TELE
LKYTEVEFASCLMSFYCSANFRSAREILCVSGPDLQRLTRLSKTDVQRLHCAVAAAVRKSKPVTALQLIRGECPVLEAGNRLSFSCRILDGLMRGGLPLRGITELAGEITGAFCLQLCLSVQYPQENGGLNSGAVYICTEDSFPIKRLRQLIALQPRLRPDLPPALIHSQRFSDNIYIEHAVDLEALQACVSQRVPVLLKRGLVRLLVVDSVAALFRSEFQADEAVQRSRHLLAFSNTLHRLSHEYGAPVVCVNQVTDVVDGPNPGRCDYGLVGSKVLPALGIAWANQVMVRLMLKRQVQSDSRSSAPRKLEVVFAPHLPRASCLCGVWEEGVRGIPDDHSDLQPQGSS